jgi:hypothetical protein
MTGLAPPATPWSRPRRRRGLMVWIAVACIAAVVIEVGAVTDGFGIPGLLQPQGTSSPPPTGPNPNPYGEPIVAIWASVAYGSSAQPFPNITNTNLCHDCPLTPKENTAYDPPVAGLWIYFNVTNVDATSANLGNFSLNTSGSEPALFELVSVVCCYSPHGPSYGEVVTRVSFTPGMTFGFAAYAFAVSIPYDGTTGYSLYLNSTSP